MKITISFACFKLVILGAKVKIKSLITKYLVEENYCCENIENILYNYCHYENSKLIMIFFEETKLG